MASDVRLLLLLSVAEKLTFPFTQRFKTKLYQLSSSTKKVSAQKRLSGASSANTSAMHDDRHDDSDTDFDYDTSSSVSVVSAVSDGDEDDELSSMEVDESQVQAKSTRSSRKWSLCQGRCDVWVWAVSDGGVHAGLVCLCAYSGIGEGIAGVVVRGGRHVAGRDGVGGVDAIETVGSGDVGGVECEQQHDLGGVVSAVVVDGVAAVDQGRRGGHRRR